MSALDQLGLRREFQHEGEARLGDRVLSRLEAVAAFDLGSTLDSAVEAGELDASQAETAGSEFRRFLALTVLANQGVSDVEDRIAGPSPLVDKVWHECLENEAGYNAMCDEVLGFKLGHGVDEDGPKEEHSSKPMVDLLAEFFVKHDANAWSGKLADCWPIFR